MLNEHFRGTKYRLADNWHSAVNPENYKNIPIKYLEVGAFYGANAISVANTYAAHPESELHLVDPWEDYSEYPEYKTEQPKIHDQFLRNIESSGAKDKMKIHRGFSNVEIPQFADEYFDIIYIDGNHEPEFVMEDAVLSFRKLKKDGIMIFDDYGWGGPDLTQRGIDGFLSGYHKRIRNLGTHETQVFLQKLS